MKGDGDRSVGCSRSGVSVRTVRKIKAMAAREMESVRCEKEVIKARLFEVEGRRLLGGGLW